MTEPGQNGKDYLPETVADSVLAAPLVRYAAKNQGQYVSAKNEPAFVLTTWPWRETSLIVSLFTRRHGRITAVARGAKRPAGRFRGLPRGFHESYRHTPLPCSDHRRYSSPSGTYRGNENR